MGTFKTLKLFCETGTFKKDFYVAGTSDPKKRPFMGMDALKAP